MDIATILSKPYAKLLIPLFGRHYVPIWHQVHGSNIKEIIDQYYADKTLLQSHVKYDRFQNATYGRRRHYSTDIVSTYHINYEIEAGQITSRLDMTKEVVDFINTRKGEIFRTNIYLLKDFKQENYYSRCFWPEKNERLIEQYHVWLYEEPASMHYQNFLDEQQLEIEFTSDFNHLKQITWVEPSKRLIYEKHIFHILDNGDICVEKYLRHRNTFMFTSCRCYDACYNFLFDTIQPLTTLLPIATRQRLTVRKYDFDDHNNWTSVYSWDTKTKDWLLSNTREISYYLDLD